MVQGTPKLLGRRKTVGLPAEAPAARFDADVTLAAVAREVMCPSTERSNCPLATEASGASHWGPCDSAVGRFDETATNSAVTER